MRNQWRSLSDDHRVSSHSKTRKYAINSYTITVALRYSEIFMRDEIEVWLGRMSQSILAYGRMGTLKPSSDGVVRFRLPGVIFVDGAHCQEVFWESLSRIFEFVFVTDVDQNWAWAQEGE
ncbi:hypothetical protein WUBG_00879 [Wuchereria bancrofti]|uniref:Uncharacterized protein n=1 Tax=Wuchereria bancrofti TaxID=6293 RepID=J9F134_WUCBA|nr:hypothetical protein WUBG_00879 [Wuchereria bancrofti]